MFNFWSKGTGEYLSFMVKRNDNREKIFLFSSCYQLWKFVKILAGCTNSYSREIMENSAKYMAALIAFLIADAPDDEKNSLLLMNFLVATDIDLEIDPVRMVFDDFENIDAEFERTELEEEFRNFSLELYHDYKMIPSWEKREVVTMCLSMVCILNSDISDFYWNICGERKSN